MGFFDLFKPTIEIPAGGRSVGLYIYDSSRLPKMRDGDSILVEYAPGKHEMVSDSGNVSKTEGAFSYLGRIFGCTFRDDIIRDLKRAAEHGKVVCTMVCLGINSHGYPQLDLAIPDARAMKSWLKSLDS